MADPVNRSGSWYSASRDGNKVPTTLGVSSTDGVTPTPLEVNTSDGGLLVHTTNGGSGGGGTQYQELATTTPATGTLSLGRYQTSLPTLTNGQMNEPMLDATSTLLVNSSTLATAANQSTMATTLGTLSTSANQTNGNQQTKLTDGTNTANVVAGDSGFNGVNTGAATKSYTFTTSSSGAQVLGPYNCGGFSWVSIHYTTNSTSGLSLGGQFSQTSGGTFSSVVNFEDIFSGSTPTSLGATLGHYYITPVSDNYFQINITALTSGTLSGTITLSNKNAVFSNNAVTATQNGTWTVGSNSATGSAVPANAFYTGVSDQSGKLTGAVSANTAAGTTGTGLLGGGILGYDGTDWQYAGIDAYHDLKSTIRDAAGNARGANVDANGNLNVSIANTGTNSNQLNVGTVTSGVTGSTIPSSADYVGMLNSSGNLQGLTTSGYNSTGNTSPDYLLAVSNYMTNSSSGGAGSGEEQRNMAAIGAGSATGIAAVGIGGGLMPIGTKLNTYEILLTTNTTTTVTASTAYISSIVITVDTGQTGGNITIQDGQGTPQILVNGLSTVTATLSPTTMDFSTPIKMTTGIKIITASSVTASTISVWINYYQ